jgi:hypothetical protein
MLAGGAVADPLSFSATDVTATRVVDFDGVDGHRDTSELAASIAAALNLPENALYALRDNKRGSMLRDGNRFGVGGHSKVTLGLRIPGQTRVGRRDAARSDRAGQAGDE